MSYQVRSGPLDREITIQSRTLATNGDPAAFTWADHATVFAEKLNAGSIERFVGQQVAAEASQAFRIRYRNDLDPTMRVTDEDGIWNIIGTPEGQGRRAETILLVTRLDPRDE